MVKEEILSGLRELGLHPSLQAAEDLWESLLKVDANNNGKIEFLEFEKFVLFRDEELWKIFAKIDEDRSGHYQSTKLHVRCIPMVSKQQSRPLSVGLKK